MDGGMSLMTAIRRIKLPNAAAAFLSVGGGLTAYTVWNSRSDGAAIKATPADPGPYPGPFDSQKDQDWYNACCERMAAAAAEARAAADEAKAAAVEARAAANEARALAEEIKALLGNESSY